MLGEVGPKTLGDAGPTGEYGEVVPAAGVESPFDPGLGDPAAALFNNGCCCTANDCDPLPVSPSPCGVPFAGLALYGDAEYGDGE